jgi:hypothetical protein
VVTDSVPPFSATEIVKLLEAVWTGELESFTCRVNVEFPFWVGVPVICPDGDKTNPAGNEPDGRLQVYGAAPPVADRMASYAVSVAAAGRTVEEICSGVSVATIWMLKLAVTLSAGEPESKTFAEKKNVPDCVGVPVIAPEMEFRLVPVGSCPEETNQLYGAVPPVALRVALYAKPCCPLLRDCVVIAKGVTAVSMLKLKA